MAALLALAGLVWWGLRPSAPQVPPHPLSLVAPGSVIAVAADAAALPTNSPAYRAAAALPAKLARQRPGQGEGVNWAGARQFRLDTAPGILIWLQLVPSPQGGWVRVNADAAPGASPAALQRARAIKALRLGAYRIGPAEAAALLQGTSPAPR